jgi:hypothetical protein
MNELAEERALESDENDAWEEGKENAMEERRRG